MQNNKSFQSGDTSDFSFGAKTDTGKNREENQDAFTLCLDMQANNPAKGLLMAVADGMGGHRGGSVASNLALSILITEYYKLEPDDILEALIKAFERANEAVHTLAGDDDARYGKMGTTMTAVVLKDNAMYFAHVGDSRGYIIEKDTIRKFTEDHSYVASLLKAGAITEKQAINHPSENIITRAVGLEPEIKMDFSHMAYRLKKGQYVLLCSDGLYKVVSNEEILKTIKIWVTPDFIAKKLVELANDNGGPDNITVLVAYVNKRNKIKAAVKKVKMFLGK